MFPVAALLSIGKWLFGWGSEYLKSRAETEARLEEAKINAKIKEQEAAGELAAYKLKADVEWDLKWAEASQRSWKDEYLIALWSLPFLGFFIPQVQPYVISGFKAMSEFNVDAAWFYFSGWPVIFAASFGLKAAMEYMRPAHLSEAIKAMAAAPDDIPAKVVEDITERLKSPADHKAMKTK